MSSSHGSLPASPNRSPNRSPTPPSRAPAAYREHAGDRQFATTLARGLELLRCFTPQAPLLANKDLAERLHLPRATVSRLTYTLLAMGYLAQDRDSGKVRLGAGVVSLGFPLLETFPIRQRARAGMLELAQQVRGAVAIAIRDRLDMVCIEVARTGERSGHPVDIGRTYSMCGTAVGRAYLAACGADEQKALLNQIRVKAPEQWARYREGLLRNLELYPQRGVCTSVGEVYADVQAVAVPLGRIDRGELVALNVAFQRRTLDERRLLKEVAPALLALARRVACAGGQASPCRQTPGKARLPDVPASRQPFSRSLVPSTPKLEEIVLSARTAHRAQTSHEQQRRTLLRALAAAAAGIGAAAPARAQDYPSRQIRIVVPFAPGGGGDVLGRLIAQHLGEQTRQNVIVENKPGASSIIASDLVAKSAPDGYTLLLNVPLLVQTPALFSKLPYDALADLTPVTDLVSSPVWFAVGADKVSARSLKEYVEQARARPRDFNYASIGAGSSGHLLGYALNDANQLDTQHVPYKGSAPAMQALLAGEVASVFLDYVTLKAQVQAGKVRLLAVTGTQRSAVTPAVPTLAELGYPGFESAVWAGIFVPARTPRDVLAALEAALRKVIAQPEYQSRVRELGYEPGGTAQTAFAAQVKADHARWGALIRKVGVKLD